MTRRQKVALAQPCYRAADTVHRRFWEKDGPWGSLLTVNK